MCCKYGLFWQGLIHDLSKFSITEFRESRKNFTGIYSPIDKCRREKGYSLAWLHHNGRNKHHLEYWYDRQNKNQMNIPYKYAVECVCDRIAAAKSYNGKNYKPENVLEHWSRVRNNEPTNETMKLFFDKVFTDLANNGEKCITSKKYIKQVYNDIVLNN